MFFGIIFSFHKVLRLVIVFSHIEINRNLPKFLISYTFTNFCGIIILLYFFNVFVRVYNGRATDTDILI